MKEAWPSSTLTLFATQPPDQCATCKGPFNTKNEYNFFNRKLDAEYYFIRQFFQKKRRFLGKLRDVGRQNRRIYHLFCGNRGTKYCFNFFSETTILADLNLKNWFLGTHFPSYAQFYWLHAFENNRVYTRVNPHQPCEFHENWFKITTCIVRYYTYINILYYIIETLFFWLVSKFWPSTPQTRSDSSDTPASSYKYKQQDRLAIVRLSALARFNNNENIVKIKINEETGNNE